MSEKHIFTVSDMTCSHCEATVKEAVRSVNGVVDVDVNLDTKQVTVNFDASKTSEEAIKKAIADKGYTVQ